MFFLYREYAVNAATYTKQNKLLVSDGNWLVGGRGTEEERKGGKRIVWGMDIVKQYYIQPCKKITNKRTKLKKKSVLHF